MDRSWWLWCGRNLLVSCTIDCTTLSNSNPIRRCESTFDLGAHTSIYRKLFQSNIDACHTQICTFLRMTKYTFIHLLSISEPCLTLGLAWSDWTLIWVELAPISDTPRPHQCILQRLGWSSYNPEPLLENTWQSFQSTNIEIWRKHAEACLRLTLRHVFKTHLPELLENLVSKLKLAFNVSFVDAKSFG